MPDLGKLDINSDEIYRYLGCRDGIPPDTLKSQVEAAIDKCRRIACARSCFGVYEIAKCDEGVLLCGTDIIFRGNDIAEYLNKVSKCAVAALTLGVSVEREISKLSRFSMSDAVVFDAVCGGVAESFAETVQTDILKETGMYTSYRYSPGYGDFPIETQRDIISLLSCDKKIGLTVTDSYMLLPSKSITAVIALYDEASRCKTDKCDRCNMRDTCKFRRTGNACRA